MLGTAEIKVNRPRDGRHCDLCGCSFPAVRCDKCGSQIFCLSCDDMYHRHPKRRFHLRKAVDTTPIPQARPMLPAKASQLPVAPGDPSKMPLPPPRKKKPGKSFFDTFRRGSPSADHSPPLPKKEYSWTDRLGSIKKFMSNRPLPPIPKDITSNSPSEQNSFNPNDVEEKPPQLPMRTQHINSVSPLPPQKLTENKNLFPNLTGGEMHPKTNIAAEPLKQSISLPQAHVNGQIESDFHEKRDENMHNIGRPRGFSLGDTGHWGLDASVNINQHPSFSPGGMPGSPPLNQNEIQGFGTMRRQQQNIMHPLSSFQASAEQQTGMHQSASATDLHALAAASPVQGMPPYPHFPANPHLPPHYPSPYPIYPQYPNYPHYFGNSWANLASPLPTTDGDFSDHSESPSHRFHGKKHRSNKNARAKRSQSVMYDPMAYPGQYYPFGPYPPSFGAQSWLHTQHMEAPPSPASSIRSLNRTGRSRRKKKAMKDDDDASVCSSSQSRAKSSSSERPRKHKPATLPKSTTSEEEEEEEEEEKHDEENLDDEIMEAMEQEQENIERISDKRQPSVKKKSSPTQKISNSKYKHSEQKQPSPAPVAHKEEKQEEKENTDDELDQSQEQEQEIEVDENEEDYCSAGEDETLASGGSRSPRVPSEKWQCEHCTFINPAGERICQVCCKSAIRVHSPAGFMTPENQMNIENNTEPHRASPEGQMLKKEINTSEFETERQDMVLLNTALEEAEKEISRGLEELMKFKEDITSDQVENETENVKENQSKLVTCQQSVVDAPEPKPVYKMSTKFQSTSSENSAGHNFQTSNKHETNHFPSRTTNAVSVGTATDAGDSSIANEKVASNMRLTQHEVGSGTSDVTTQMYSTGISGSHKNFENDINTSSIKNQLTKLPPSVDNHSEERKLRRDSSCQTQQDTISDFIQRRESQEGPFQATNGLGSTGGYQYPYNRMEAVMSPTQQNVFSPSFDRGFGGGYGGMYRSHSRASLFGGRLSDTRPVPMEYDNLGFGFGPSSMYRSLSRTSLTGDSSENWVPEFRPLRKPDFYLSMEELVERRRQETMRAQGLELVRMIREAEQQGFTADDIQVALNNCGKQNPVDWLQDNWKNMVETVVTLATNYGHDKKENDIGVVCDNEARDALRLHKGNIWAAVTECVESRQRKFLELSARGNFTCKEIVCALTSSQGNVEMAYAQLTKATLKPFLMRIWGPGEGAENQEGAMPRSFTSDSQQKEAATSGNLHFKKSRSQLSSNDSEFCDDRAEQYSEQDDLWDEDYDDKNDEDEEVAWNDNEEDAQDWEEYKSDLQSEVETNRKDKGNISNIQASVEVHKIQTPESDKSEYCDAYDPPSEERTMSSPVDEIFFLSVDAEKDATIADQNEDKKKGTSFLSRLAALRKEGKSQSNKKMAPVSEDIDHEMPLNDNQYGLNKESESDNVIETAEFSSASNELPATELEQTKTYGAFDILKQTFSAIKDTMTGASTKSDKNVMPERRTIVVHGRLALETLPSESTEGKKSPTAYEFLPIQNVESTSEILANNIEKIKDITENPEFINKIDLLEVCNDSSTDRNGLVEERKTNVESENKYLEALSETDTHVKNKKSEKIVTIPDQGISNAVIENNVVKGKILTEKDFKNEISGNETNFDEPDNFHGVGNIENKNAHCIISDKTYGSQDIKLETINHQAEELKLFKENRAVTPSPQTSISVCVNSNSVSDKTELPIITSVKTELPIITSAESSREKSESLGITTDLPQIATHEYVNDAADFKREKTSGQYEYQQASFSKKYVKKKAQHSNAITHPVKADDQIDKDKSIEDKEIFSLSASQVVTKEDKGGDHSSLTVNSNGISTLLENEKIVEPKSVVSEESQVFVQKSNFEEKTNVKTPEPSEKNSFENDVTQKGLTTLQTTSKIASFDKIHESDPTTLENSQKLTVQKSEIIGPSTNDLNGCSESENKTNSDIVNLTQDSVSGLVNTSNVISNEVKENQQTMSEESENLNKMSNDSEKLPSDISSVSETSENIVDSSNSGTISRTEGKPLIKKKNKVKGNYVKESTSKLLETKTDQSQNSTDANNESKDADNIVHTIPQAEAKTESESTDKMQSFSDDDLKNRETAVNKLQETSDLTTNDQLASKSKSSVAQKGTIYSFPDIESTHSANVQNEVIQNILNSDNDISPKFEAGVSSSITNTEASINVRKVKALSNTKNTEATLNIKNTVATADIENNKISTVLKNSEPNADIQTVATTSDVKNADFIDIKNVNVTEADGAMSDIKEKAISSTLETINVDNSVTKSESSAFNNSDKNLILSTSLNESVKSSSSNLNTMEAATSEAQISPFSEINLTDVASADMQSKQNALSLNLVNKEINNFEKTENQNTLHSIDLPTRSQAIDNQQTVSDTAASPVDIPPMSPTATVKTPIPFAASKIPSSPVDSLRNMSPFDRIREDSPSRSSSPLRPQSPFGRMTFTARKEAIAQERNKEIVRNITPESKPQFIKKSYIPPPKRSIKQQLEFERRVRKMVADRKCRTYRKAEIVIQLLDLKFEEKEAIQAAQECSTLEQAISYLQQECLLCTGKYPVSQIISMVHCPHKACQECIKAYFTIQIRDRTIMDLLCPFCNEPDIGDEDVAQDYFNHLDIMLKKLVDVEIHELFQRKLRDRVLMKDPNFRWCSQCSSGFIAMPNLRKLMCPDCNAITCATCRRPWEREHEGISCEAYATWKDANDPEAQAAGLAKLLTEDGIDCPSCHFRYALAKGGCMHFRCLQCQHDFCSGCSKPFKMGQKCGLSAFCEKLGLHAHHPRNCLFYLRDKEPEDLQRLLDLNNVEYNKDPPEGMDVKNQCQVLEQKETPEGMVDDLCSKEVLDDYAGLCRVHYVEYLGQLINKNAIDPLPIFENDDLELVLKRASKRLPPKSYRESEIKYREKLVKLIEAELPLDKIEGS